MASENSINQLKNTAEQIESVDTRKLTRPNLGDESLKSILQPKLDELNDKLSFAIEHAPTVHETYVNNIRNSFQNIYDQMNNLANLTNAQYINQRQSFLNNFQNYLDEIYLHWAPFVTAAVEIRGLIEDEGIKKFYDKMLLEMKTNSSKSIENLRQEANNALSEARQLAEDIENRARRTAARISVKDAQDQFSEAQKGFDREVRNWSFLSGAALVVFVGFAAFLWFQHAPSETGSAIYYTAIRLTVLAALAAISTFSLRILRAHLHMRQQNLHRQRIANSIAAFVESAVTPEQRDQILSHLVQSVVAFGASGLIRYKDDHLNPSRLAIDSVTRMIKLPESK